jgi:hypothetical protein
MREYEVIKDIICRGENISPEIVEQAWNLKKRKRELVFTRQLIFYFIREHSKLSLNNIGALLHKDHATVMHAIKTIKNLVEVDKGIRIKVDLYRDKIRMALDFSYLTTMRSIKTIKSNIEYCILNDLEIPEDLIREYNKIVKGCL